MSAFDYVQVGTQEIFVLVERYEDDWMEVIAAFRNLSDAQEAMNERRENNRNAEIMSIYLR